MFFMWIISPYVFQLDFFPMVFRTRTCASSINNNGDCRAARAHVHGQALAECIFVEVVERH